MIFFKNVNSSWLIYLSVLFGVIVPLEGNPIKTGIKIILILIMSISLSNFKITSVGKNELLKGVRLSAIHYILLSTLLIIASFLIKNIGYRQGMVLLGAIPPAIGIIAVAKNIDEKIDHIFIGLLISYLFSFLYLPIILNNFFNLNIGIVEIGKTFIVFIVIPFGISRLLHYKQIMNKWNVKVIINCLYAILFYFIISLKSDTFKHDFFGVWPIFIIMFSFSMVLGTIVFILIPKRYEKSRLDYVLFSTYKNTGLASAIAVSYLHSDALVPISIRAIFSPIMTIVMFALINRQREKYRR